MSECDPGGVDIETDVVHEPNKKDLFERAVYEVSDRKFWKFPEKEPGSTHPGVCWRVDSDRREAVLYKGTSQQPKKSRYLLAYAVVAPNGENGLDVLTYFKVNDPHVRRLRHVELLEHDRRRGRLSETDAQTIEEALNELRK
ncbi:MAG: hypothetical protein WD049_05825 [Candidatus Paceibacterota bacterium]